MSSIQEIKYPNIVYEDFSLEHEKIMKITINGRIYSIPSSLINKNNELKTIDIVTKHKQAVIDIGLRVLNGYSRINTTVKIILDVIDFFKELQRKGLFIYESHIFDLMNNSLRPVLKKMFNKHCRGNILTFLFRILMKNIHKHKYQKNDKARVTLRFKSLLYFIKKKNYKEIYNRIFVCDDILVAINDVLIGDDVYETISKV